MKRLLAAAILTISACTQAPPDAYFERQVATLQSQDWSARFEALSRLEAYGSAANEALLGALADKSDIISSQAQNWLIRQGHTVVPFLADALTATEEDSGLFARIAGGREEHRGKSIAATLWLTLGRGVDPDRRFDELQKLLRHPSPRVRSVAVFTAVSLRSRDYLPILEQAATDSDPLVQQTLRRGFVRLLQRGSYSTPALDAETEQQALELFAPMIAEAAEDDALGFTQGETTFGAMLGNDALEHHRSRFMDLLKAALESEELTSVGQRNIGLALLHQAKPEELEGLAEELVAEAGLGEARPEGENALPATLVALSVFPDAALPTASLEALVGRLETARGPYRSVARLATSTYSRATAQGDTELGERARSVLESLLNDEASVAEAAIAAAPLMARGRGGGAMAEAAASIREAIGERIETLWNHSADASVEQISELIQIFLMVGDERYFDLFKRVWEHRSTVSMRDEQLLSACLGLFGWGLKDGRLIEMLLPFVDEARTAKHSLVLDTAAAVLVGALLDKHQGFWSDEVFASWMAILEDPEVHPRLRARMSMMVGSEALSTEQSDAVRAALIRIAGGPVGANLRDKILSRLTYRGDRRVLPEAYALLTVRDQVHWALSNVISDLPGTAWKIETDELIEILDGMCKRYGPPDDEVRLVVPNNYFNWAVQYQIYPPRRVADELRNRTQQDFGYDAEAWRRWLEENESS